MAVTLTDLPPEVRIKIYDLVLKDTVITLIIENEQSDIIVERNASGAITRVDRNAHAPSQEDIKSQLLDQKHAIALPWSAEKSTTICTQASSNISAFTYATSSETRVGIHVPGTSRAWDRGV